jgi:hypothetical protein
LSTRRTDGRRRTVRGIAGETHYRGRQKRPGLRSDTGSEEKIAGQRKKGSAGSAVIDEEYRNATPEQREYWFDINNAHDDDSPFKIDINELGKTQGRRKSGTEVIIANGASPRRIWNIEKSLEKYHDGTTIDHTRNEKEEWEGYCTKGLRLKLGNLYTKLKEKKENHRKLKLPLKIVSGYRRLGTHVEDDPSGVDDAGDSDRGHWLGESVDLVNSDALDYTQHIINTCFAGDSREFEKFLHGCDLCRPWRSGEDEKNHITHYKGNCPGF